MFNPEKVERWVEDGTGLIPDEHPDEHSFVRATDYDQLLELYRAATAATDKAASLASV
jgi:Ni,Fe-hydrogenase III component G